MARSIAIERLVSAIEAVEDDELLIELYEVLGIPLEGHIHEIPTEALTEIEASRLEILNGQSKSHEEVMESAKQWVLESFGPTKLSGSSRPA